MVYRLKHSPSEYPGNFFLSACVAEISAYLAGRGWLQSGELVKLVEPAGEGNMNCVLRILTSQRSFILKQSRPWVEKYPSIPAPLDRALFEAAFYRTVERWPHVTAHLPKLLNSDPGERLLMLEDVKEAQDFTFLYSASGARIEDLECMQLIDFLLALHASTRTASLRAAFLNEDMRALNHEHIFALPLRERNGLDLDAITPGLASLARALRSDAQYTREVSTLGIRYLDPSQGECLIHGDYFPGSWLRAKRQVYVIDPEFCFYGPPEWDLAVMLAHLHISGHSPAVIEKISARYAACAPIDTRLVAQFAGVEVMRRLIGVAQLPLVCGLERKAKLLSLSKQLVVGERA